MDSEPITFRATLAKIQTMIDGGIRVTFDVPDSDAKGALRLHDIRASVLGVAVVPEPVDEFGVG